MSSRTRIERHLDEDAIDEAIVTAQREGEARLLRRLCFVKNCYHGDSLTTAGERVGVSSATASRWARAWNADSVDGLRPTFGGGRPPELDERQRERLTAVLREWPLTTAEVAALIEAAFGVSYTHRHVRRLLEEVEHGDGTTTARGPSTDPEADRETRFAAALDALVDGERE